LNIAKRYLSPGIGRVLCFFVFILAASTGSAQKYAFTHYDIQDGLLESQVNSLALDHEHRLWIATYGGACRFDGKEFISYTRQNGLPTNFVDCVFTDRDNNQWFGTQNGLVKRVNNKLVTVKLPDSLDNRRVRNIVQDGSGNIWAGIGGRLFKVTGDTVKLQWVQDTIKRHLTCVAADKSGRIYASIYQKGLYYLDHKRWQKVVDYPAAEKSFYVARILFDKSDQQKLFLQTYTSVYTVDNGKLEPFEAKAIASIALSSYLLCSTLDADGSLWIGTTIGAYSIKNHQVTHFTSINGLTDNAIADVYKDADNNLWFATQGNGLYRYEGERFVMLDRSQGMSANEVVMGISKDKKGNILLGIDGGGLMRYDGKNLSAVDLHQQDANLRRIQFLLTDSKGTLWIGTHDGLWSYDGKAAKRVRELYNYPINGIAEDASGLLWVTTPSGCFYMENGETKHVANFYRFSSSIITLGKDSVLVGTNDGVALFVNKQLVKGFKVNELRTSAVFCMIKYRDNIVFGTDDRGIFAWDRHTGWIKNYSLKDGLNSNTIYSLVTDENGVVWAGTGRGVNRLSFDTGSHIFSVTGNTNRKSLILESNQNAAFVENNKVWIGTTRGAVIYNANSKLDKPTAPHVTIQIARLVPQLGSSAGWLNSMTLNDGATLSHDQNHLAIWFRGVDLKDPDNITYRYKLKGLDSSFSAPVNNDVVDYPSLPPGSYTFEVNAISANGVLSENTAKFSFTITPAFYQTASFRVAGIAFFVLIGFIIQNYRYRLKVKRQRVLEATRREENLKIRQQTAEDFHDELGNKLTRITVLSEILGTKMDPEQSDQKKLLEQIRQNASSLYNGTKDILWALDPKSDNLYEILNHIRDFGNELFLDTAVEFEFNGIDESHNRIKLPMEYSRNLPMIFKELLNNILKHAHATRVIINLEHADRDNIQISLSDNGCGFTQNGSYKGQGINNIITRTKRIGGSIDINSEKGRGTFIGLTVKINHKVTLN